MKLIDWIFSVAPFAIFAVVVALIVVTESDCSAKSKCRDAGGHVTEYNCRTWIWCHPVGKATICQPMRSCSWRCDDLPAERAP